MKRRYQKIIEILGEKKVKTDEPLFGHTTFQIGGPADLFYEAQTSQALIKAVKAAGKLKIPIYILGGGSNVLISDRGIRGLVIKCTGEKYQLERLNGQVKVTADSGMKLGDLVSRSVKLSLTGLEFLTGIPGTVGGAVRGNAGAWQQEIGEKVVEVMVIDKDNHVKRLSQEDCRFSYRESRFKKTREVIVKVSFALEKGEPREIKSLIRDYRRLRAAQPKIKSAGCVFVNPKPQPAGYLIDQCGLKGKRVGRAQISSKHANFIVNLGGAKAGEVISLIKLAKNKVRKKFAVELEEEVDLVGFTH